MKSVFTSIQLLERSFQVSSVTDKNPKKKFSIQNVYQLISRDVEHRKYKTVFEQK